MSEDAPKKAPITTAEAGRKGGNVVKSAYGRAFYEAIGRKGGEMTKKTNGPEFYHMIGKKGGKKGGDATRDKYGPEFYEEIGKKGGQKIKALLEAGKKALADKAKDDEP